MGCTLPFVARPISTRVGGHSVIGHVGLGVRIDNTGVDATHTFVNQAPGIKSNYTFISMLQKFLAQFALGPQARSAMSRFARSTNRGRGFIAICVSVAFLWALALSASPQLHQRVHSDAGRVEHSCAATMIASGSYNHAAHPSLLSAPVPAVQFSKIPVLTPHWVESPFLGACIFEHAPPARA